MIDELRRFLLVLRLLGRPSLLDVLVRGEKTQHSNTVPREQLVLDFRPRSPAKLEDDFAFFERGSNVLPFEREQTPSTGNS